MTGHTHQLWGDSPRGRIASRKSYVSGRIALGLDSARDAISANAQIRTQLKLAAVGFLSWIGHGAGQHAAGQAADEMFDYLGTAPEEAGVAVLAPNSRDRTWDAIADGSFFWAGCEIPESRAGTGD